MTTAKKTSVNKTTKKYYTVSIPCKKRTVSVSATQRIMNVETGQILAILQESRQRYDEVCKNESSKSLATASHIAEIPAAQIADLFARQFLSHTEKFEYELDKIKTKQFKKQAEEEGLPEIFRAAGAEWREAGCSMCIAMNGDQLSPGQYSVSTSNRNFEG